jgi:hypothetical protein
MRLVLLSASFLLAFSNLSAAGPDEQLFDNPMFRRCVSWMLSGERGALIQDLCLDQYEMPPPSLFLCARKVQTGFTSATDQEACAIVYEEETKKVRAGYVREMPEY